MNAIEQNTYLERLWNPDRSRHGGIRMPAMPASGVVVSADDPLDQGRLRVYCQALRDDPRNPESIPWAMYCSPFYGTINDNTMVRGPEGDTTVGAVTYGFHAVPEVGSEVLITTINGDPNSRVWLGSIPSHQQINTWGTGRYIWSDDGFADGPYSGGTRGETETNSPENRIQPTYDNLDAAFSGKKKSPEWLTRGADLQPLTNSSASEYTGNRDQRVGEIQDILRRERGPGAQLAKHNADIITGPGYGWSGIRSGLSKSSRVSRVMGITTPGFHSFTLDDRHGNCRIRLRTTAGSQLLLDDTNERIYFSTARGNSYHEMDFNGNIDVYAGKRASVHAEEDINFTAGRDIRFHAGRSIHAVAGESALAESEQNLPAALPPGQIRFHSMDDMHLYSDKNIRTYSNLETLMTSHESFHIRTNNQLSAWSKSDTNIFASIGSILATAGINIAATATKDVSLFAGGNLSGAAVGATHIASYTGKMDISAGGGALLKVMGGNLDLQSTDSAINIQTEHNNIAFDKQGIRASTSGQVLMQGENIEARSTPTNIPDTNLTETPGSENCSGNGPFPYLAESITAQGYTVKAGVDNIARACFNSGWRGADLVTMVAIIGQESRFGHNVRGPATTDSGKSTVNDPTWMPSCLGPFQMRCYRNPDKYGSATSLEGGRRVTNAMDLDKSAKWAYKLYKARGFGQWSGYTDGNYKKYLTTAKQAVDRLCGTTASGANSVVPAGTVPGGAAPGSVVSTPNSLPTVIPGSSAPAFSPPALPEPNLDVSSFSPTVSSLKITADSVRVQGTTDVFIKTGVDDISTSVQCLRVKMDDIVESFNATSVETLGYIHDTTDQFKSMILSMAVSLQTGLAQAANETTPTAAIAAMVQVVSDLNSIVQLVSNVSSSINAFSGYPESVLGGVYHLQDILAMDMDMSAFIPPEITTLRNDIEQAYYELRTAGTSIAAADRALGTVGDILGVDTSNSLPTPPSECP